MFWKFLTVLSTQVVSNDYTRTYEAALNDYDLVWITKEILYTHSKSMNLYVTLTPS